jgi:hypothetical protein
MADDSSRRNSTHSRQRLTLLMEPLLNAFEHGSNEDAAMFGAKLVDNPRHCIGIERSHRTEQVTNTASAALFAGRSFMTVPLIE